MLHIETTDCKTVQLCARLDSENVSETELQLFDSLSNTKELLIDLNELEHIDVSGIFMLYMFRQKAFLRGKKIKLIIHNDNIRKIIQHSRMGYLFF